MHLNHFTTSTLISSTEVELTGYSIKANADSVITFHNSDDDAGPGVVYILLGEGQSITDEVNLNFEDGIYLEVDGDVEGSVWTR